MFGYSQQYLVRQINEPTLYNQFHLAEIREHGSRGYNFVVLVAWGSSEKYPPNPPVTDKTIPFLYPLIQYDPITKLLTVHATKATKKILKGLNSITTSQLLSSTGPI